MDTSSADQLTNTNNTPTTGNPQDSAGTSGASNAADFQSTAPNEILNQQVDNLSVARMGEPATTPTNDNTTDYRPYVWGVSTVVILIAAAATIIKLIRSDEELVPIIAAPAPAKTVSAERASKTPVKKTTKKKSAPNHRRKKTAKKRK